MRDVYEDERVAVFIDGNAIQSAMNKIGVRVNYASLYSYLRENCRLISARYYVSIEESDNNPIVKLLDSLRYNNYVVNQKFSKEFENHEGNRVLRGRNDVEIAVDVMNMLDRVDHLVLFACKGDFTYLVKVAQMRGVRVSLLTLGDESKRNGSGSMHTGMLAEDLRSQVDGIIMMSSIDDVISMREPLGSR